MADEVKPERVRADSYRSVYVNGSIMGFTQWDIQITLSTSFGPGGGAKFEDQLTVLQSPTHAKALLRGLARTVASYEAKFGPIPEPAGKSVVVVEGVAKAVEDAPKPKRSTRRPASRS